MGEKGRKELTGPGREVGLVAEEKKKKKRH